MDKMTNERAIEILEKDNRSLGKGLSPYNPILHRAVEEISANNTAIIAIQKQIPHKKLFDGVDTYTCPSCEEEVYDEEYCQYCGQKLIVE